MKVITQIDDDILFMKKLYGTAKLVEKYLRKTKVMKVRERAPIFSGNETPEEKTAMLTEQAKENILEMARIIMEEHPEGMIEIARAFIILDEGEDYPHGVKLISTITNALCDKDMLDFFSSLTRLVQTNI